MIEQFSVQFRKTKTTVLTKANWSAGRHQSQPVGIQVKNRQISFESDWMRRWRDFLGPITARNWAKAKQSWINFDTQLKTALCPWWHLTHSTASQPGETDDMYFHSPMYVKWKETFSFDLTVNCISSPASWATQGHQPYTLFDSNKDTVSTLLLALPSSYEGICCRLHLLALLAGLGIRFRFSSNWPGKKTTRFGWNISLIENQGWPPLSRIQI